MGDSANGPWQILLQLILVISFSVNILATCDGTGPCHKAHLSCGRRGGSSVAGVPLQSLSSAAEGCDIGRSRNVVERVGKSGFGGRTVIARRLGEGVGSAGGDGIRLSMAHRSSHISESNIHRKEALRQLLARDVLRMNRFARQAEVAFGEAISGSLKAEEMSSFPDITHPGGRNGGNPNARNSTSTINGLYNFESTVGSGVQLGSGEYFMDFFVGSPPRLISVIIDTGSDLTWVQCDPCKLCYHQEGSHFNPNASSSYESLTCDSDSCKSAGGFGEDPEGRCAPKPAKPGVCKYFYYYGDQSNTTGDFALETVTFNVSGGAPLQIEQILFGCGYSNVGLFQGSGGLLGLGQGAISFVSQIGSLFGNKFSYCLVNRDNPLKVKSPLIFGEDTAYAKLEDKMQWTPFLRNTPIDTFYYVNITGVSIGGELLPISDSAWEIDPQGYGGSIIDSGTTLTYFKQEAYDMISQKFQDLVTYPRVSSVPVLELCFNISDVESPDFPAFNIHFQDNAVMELPLKNYFIRADPDDRIYCLALLPVPSKNINIIGNFQQQNFHVVYDRGNSRLGFAPVDCTSAL